MLVKVLPQLQWRPQYNGAAKTMGQHTHAMTTKDNSTCGMELASETSCVYYGWHQRNGVAQTL